MSVLNKIIVGACALASLTRAAPVVLTITDIVTVTTWETVYGTSTVYEPIDQSPAATTSSSSSTSTEDVASVTTTTSSTTSTIPADQALALSTPAAIYTTPAVVYTTPAVFVQQTTSITTTAVYTTPAVATPVQPTTLVTQTTPLIAQVAATGAAVSGGQCQGQGSACTGDVTHWDGGMGACGWTVNTASDMQVSLPVGLMGSLSNSNPYCGKSVSIKSTSGSIIQATVGDKCMGCTGTSIDLTDALFNAVTDGKGDGRVSGVSWWFN